MLLGLALYILNKKDQAEELFPSTIEVGFQMRCSFANVLSFYPQICGTEQLTPPFVRQLRPELIRYLPAFCIIFSYLFYVII